MSFKLSQQERPLSRVAVGRLSDNGLAEKIADVFENPWVTFCLQLSTARDVI